MGTWARSSADSFRKTKKHSLALVLDLVSSNPRDLSIFTKRECFMYLARVKVERKRQSQAPRHHH